MNEIQNELHKIVSDVRMHLEFQKALGVRVVETAAVSAASSAAVIPPAAAKTIQTREGTQAGKAAAPEPGMLEAVREELGDCTRCKLHKGRKTIVFGEGKHDAVVAFVGEGPGQEEDQQGRPFVGAAGQLLTDIIVKGMKLKREDVYICNIVKCRPPDNRNPDPAEIAACEPFLIRQLQAIKPKIIVALGNVAVKTLLKTSEGITTLRGAWKRYQGIPLMPTFHPAYLLRNPRDKALVWEDIKEVITEMKKGS